MIIAEYLDSITLGIDDLYYSIPLQSGVLKVEEQQLLKSKALNSDLRVARGLNFGVVEFTTEIQNHTLYRDLAKMCDVGSVYMSVGNTNYYLTPAAISKVVYSVRRPEFCTLNIEIVGIFATQSTQPTTLQIINEPVSHLDVSYDFLGLDLTDISISSQRSVEVLRSPNGLNRLDVGMTGLSGSIHAYEAYLPTHEEFEFNVDFKTFRIDSKCMINRNRKIFSDNQQFDLIITKRFDIS